MIIKLLDKHSTSFLTEPFIENIINPLKYNKKSKRLANKRISGQGENNIRSNVGLINGIDHSNLLKTQESNCIKIPNWPYGPKENSRFLYFIKGESSSANMKKAESQIIKQFFANKINLNILATQSSEIGNQSDFARQGASSLPLHFLFSLHQIKSEKLEQARLLSLGSQANLKGASNPIKRIQNKNYSEFKNQLRECKKIRLLYGHLSKRDLQKSLVKIQQSQGLSSENLLIYLETRLDVILERCGFFPSIKAARQSVLHGRIQINSKIIKIPSFQLKPGDIIKVALSMDAGTSDQIQSSAQKSLNFQRRSVPITSLTVKEWYSDVVVGVRDWISNYLSKVIGTCKHTSSLTIGQRGGKPWQGCKTRDRPYSKMQSISERLKGSKKSLGASTQSVCSLTTFVQTHSYFQCILFLLSLLKSKTKERRKIPLPGQVRGVTIQAKLNNLRKEYITKVEAPRDFSNRSTTTSVISPSLNIWRFNLSPYVIFSILEIQSMLRNFVLKSLNSKLLFGTPAGANSRHNHFLSRSTFAFKDFPGPTSPQEPCQAGFCSGQDRLAPKGASTLANKNNEKKCLGVYTPKKSGMSSQSSISIRNTEINLEKSFLNVFYYWLEVKNRLLYPKSKLWRQAYYMNSQFIVPKMPGLEGVAPLAAISATSAKSDPFKWAGFPVFAPLLEKAWDARDFSDKRFKEPLENIVEDVNTLCKPDLFFDDTCIQSSFFKNKQKKTSIIFPPIQMNYFQKQSKPLHLEISYSSLCAIFLFPPQQIYFSALVDVDLIVRSAAIKK